LQETGQFKTTSHRCFWHHYLSHTNLVPPLSHWLNNVCAKVCCPLNTFGVAESWGGILLCSTWGKHHPKQQWSLCSWGQGIKDEKVTQKSETQSKI